jgi:hypothetical protein
MLAVFVSDNSIDLDQFGGNPHHIINYFIALRDGDWRGSWLL